MFKLDLGKEEEPEIKLSTSTGSQKKQENARKWFTFALLTTPKPLTVWVTTNWKILKEMGVSDHLTCLLRNLYAGQKQQLEPDVEQQLGSKSGNLEPEMEQQTGSQSGKEYVKAVYCHPAYLTSMQRTS